MMRSALAQWEPGAPGRLLAFAVTVVSAVAVSGGRSAAVFAFAVVLAILLSRQAIPRAARDRAWLVLILPAVGLSVLAGRGTSGGSGGGLSVSAQMLARGGAILLALHTLTSALSLSAIASLFERFGFKGLGFALGVAVNALPLVQRHFQDTVTALRLRGGFRRRRLRAVRLLLLTTIVNTIRHAEETIAAAEARGFSAERSAPAPLQWKRGDAALLLLLAVMAGILCNYEHF